jgi:nicotinate-nucleotide pyrophosphorylase (carboxylating)
MTTDQFIRQALAEDVGDGDHTSLACIPDEAQGRAKLLVKDQGIIAGVQLALQILLYVDSRLRVQLKLDDGDRVFPGDVWRNGPFKSEADIIIASVCMIWL